MKIECDKCGAKYSIADDKVRGKTFKIRCKKCSNVIIVRDKAEGGGADEAAASEQEQEQDAGGGEAGWHLAIDGETVGPLSEQEVRDRFAAGEIDRETSVWQEGFDDWLPLGDVDTFGDLAASSSAAAPAAAAAAAAAAVAASDPFAGGDEDYGVSSRFSEPEPEPEPAPAPAPASRAAPEPVAASHGASPRVANLTGARNENSVLFSLDSLSAVAMGNRGGGGGGGGGGAAADAALAGPSFSVAPASSAPSQTTATGEGSGLIDIRAMSAMLGDGGGGGGDAGGGGGGGEPGFGDAAIPSFGGGFGGLAAAPLSLATPESDAPIAAPEPVKSSNGPLYALIGVLALGLLGITGYILTRPPPEPQTIEKITVVQGASKADDEDEDSPKKKKKKKADEEEDDEEEGDAEGEEAADSAGGTKSTKKGSTKKGSTKKGSTDAKAEGGAAAGDGGAAKAPPKEEKPKEEDVSVDCLLDPSKCKKGGSSKPSGGSSGGSSAPPAGGSQPAKLSADDIKAGIASAKSSAESKCKSKSKGGEKVVVKISIEGSSGKVLSATADGTPLGDCVASELKNAKFKTFSAPQQGAQVSVRF